LLNPAFSEVGFGFANNPDYTSAGGGPMTIVVAFYGKPVVTPAPVAQSTPPAAPAAPSHTAVQPPAAAQPTPAAASAQPPLPITQSQAKPSQDTLQNGTPKKAEPVTTESKSSGVTLSLRTSKAQVAFAKLPISSYASGMATFGIFAAAGFWISRHLLMLRRVLVHGESFVISHPLVDVGLIVIGALSYVLSQTAGFIQ
jgi:hypothetical protein